MPQGNLLTHGKHRIMTVSAKSLDDLLEFAREVNDGPLWAGMLDTLYVPGVGRFTWDGARFESAHKQPAP